VLKATTKFREMISGFSSLEVTSEPTQATTVLEIAGAQQVIGARFFIPDSQFRTQNGCHSNTE
jgi:hypothetical protein